MVDPTDAVGSILQRIQADLADVKRSQLEHGEKLDSIEGTLAVHTERLGEMNGYLSFGLNIASRHTTEFDALRHEIEAIRRRVSVLERQD